MLSGFKRVVLQYRHTDDIRIQKCWSPVLRHFDIWTLHIDPAFRQQFFYGTYPLFILIPFRINVLNDTMVDSANSAEAAASQEGGTVRQYSHSDAANFRLFLNMQ